MDQRWGPPPVSAALRAPLRLHLHREVAQGAGREVPPGKTPGRFCALLHKESHAARCQK